jgi:hypothetical protein
MRVRTRIPVVFIGDGPVVVRSGRRGMRHLRLHLVCMCVRVCVCVCVCVYELILIHTYVR